MLKLLSHKKLAMRWLVIAFMFTSMSACDNMRDGNRYKPYEASPFFNDMRSSRPLVKGTVPRGFLRTDEVLYTGKKGDNHVKQIPLKVDDELILRGHNRFNIHCIVCHGPVGSGNGLAVERGFNQPPSFYEHRLRRAPSGYMYDVITNGYGMMSSYAKEITPKDRWAIVAYIQFLQSLKPDPEFDKQQKIEREALQKKLDEAKAKKLKARQELKKREANKAKVTAQSTQEAISTEIPKQVPATTTAPVKKQSTLSTIANQVAKEKVQPQEVKDTDESTK